MSPCVQGSPYLSELQAFMVGVGAVPVWLWARVGKKPIVYVPLEWQSRGAVKLL